MRKLVWGLVVVLLCGCQISRDTARDSGGTSAAVSDGAPHASDDDYFPAAPRGVSGFVNWSGGATWPGRNVNWAYNNKNEPASLGGQGLAIIQSAQETWKRYCGINWTYQGPTIEAAGERWPPSSPFPSVLSWTSSTPYIDQYNGQAFGFANWSFDSSIKLADVAFNYTRIGDRDTLLGTAVHEMGHALGLQHSDREESVMYASPYHDNIYRQTLRPDDIVACQLLYGLPSRIPPPMLHFRSNNATSVTLNPGQVVNYYWSASNVVSISSVLESVSGGSDACGLRNGLSWVATTSSSSPFAVPNAYSGTAAGTVAACQAGHTYVLKITALGQDGSTVEVRNTMTATGAPPSVAAPLGYLDLIRTSDGKAFGWAYDADTPSQSIWVHVYIDGAYAGAALTSLYRPDVNSAMSITGNHGFEFTIPAAYRTGTHTLRVYGIDSSGANSNPELRLSPAQFTFPTNDCGPTWPSMQTYSCVNGVQYGTVCGCIPAGADPNNIDTRYWIHQDSYILGCYKHMTGAGC